MAAAAVTRKAKTKPSRPVQTAKTTALLEAIWANPRDTKTLAVYADHLSEQGDSRGEFITLNLLRKRTDEQDDRMWALAKKDRGAWLGDARPLVRSWELSEDVPGFVGHLWCEADKLIAGFELLRWLGPQMVVSVSAIRKARRETEAKLATLPLHLLRELDLERNTLDDSSIATLAPALAGIRGLHLGSGITGTGIAALGAVCTTLEFLQVSTSSSLEQAERDALVDDIAAAIASTRGFRSLRYLHFFRTGSPSRKRASQLRQLPRLKRLSISSYTEWRGLDPKSWKETCSDDI